MGVDERAVRLRVVRGGATRFRVAHFRFKVRSAFWLPFQLTSSALCEMYGNRPSRRAGWRGLVRESTVSVRSWGKVDVLLLAHAAIVRPQEEPDAQPLRDKKRYTQRYSQGLLLFPCLAALFYQYSCLSHADNDKNNDSRPFRTGAIPPKSVIFLICRSGGMGRHTGLKILWRATAVRVRVPSPA